MRPRIEIFCMLTLLLWNVHCKLTTTTKEQIQMYENSLNFSLSLDKQDRKLVNSWTVVLQVSQVNITTSYRLQMTRHKEHNFRRINSNEKWTACMEFYRNKINKSEHLYYENESNCLKETNSKVNEKKQAVTQIEKEIRKWRKSYRYLANLCRTGNLGDEEANTCLVEYMQRDNYSLTFRRLLMLKLGIMGDLCLEINSSATKLENCLQAQLSNYLDNVRVIIETINKCYKGTKNK